MTIPRKGTERRARIDRAVYERLAAEYQHDARALAELREVYRADYPNWPEFAPAPKAEPAP